MPTKKFYYLCIAMIIVFGLIFFLQAKKAFNLTIHPVTTPLISPQTVDIPLSAEDQILGNPGAPLTIIEFGSIGCKNCTKLNYTLTEFVKQNPAKARLIWKDAPTRGLLFGGNYLAHQATYCAGKQNKFWQFLDMALQDGAGLTENGMKKIADGLKFNTTEWWQCTNSDATKKKIEDAKAVADGLGIKSAPALFVNNKEINLDEDIDIGEMLKTFTQG